jgi:hypothetical protein
MNMMMMMMMVMVMMTMNDFSYFVTSLFLVVSFCSIDIGSTYNILSLLAKLGTFSYL